MSQDQYDIFGLMAPEEAQVFEIKPKVIVGTTASEAQHAREKKGLPGEFKDGWEEATGAEKKILPVSNIPNYSAKAKPKADDVDKTAEYLSYKKIVCYAGQQIIIDDPSLNLEAIRKMLVKVFMFPEFTSKERVEFFYTGPVLPKKKAIKAESTTGDQPSLGFEASVEELDVVPSEEVEDACDVKCCDVSDEDSDSDDLENEELDGEVKDESDETVEATKKSKVKFELLPSVVDGVERFGMIVPILKGAKKGAVIESGNLERTFLKWDDLVARPTLRNLLVGCDGLYEVRITPVGIFKVRITNEQTIGAEIVSEGVDLLLPLIPADLFLAIRDFFARFALLDESLEALARIYHDGQKYFVHIPHQVVTHDSVDVLDYREDLEVAARNTLVMELHSHNVMGAYFSDIDNRDEVATGLYCVWGDLDQLAENKASLAFRFSCGGRYRKLNIMDYVKSGLSVPRHLPDVQEMDQWMSKVYVEGGEPVE